MPARCLYEKCLGISRSPKNKMMRHPAQGTVVYYYGGLLLPHSQRAAGGSLLLHPSIPFRFDLQTCPPPLVGHLYGGIGFGFLPSKACQHIGRVGFAGQYLKAPHGCIAALIFPSRI